MQEENLFERMASRYDGDFTNTQVGRGQRQIVHRYLRRIIRNGLNILEINCGTGEDALFLAGRGCRVTATDSSENMINEARIKGSEHPSGHLVTFLRVPFSDLNRLKDLGPFDLIFSNFSGLNCLDPDYFHELSETLSGLLRPEGSLVLVLFGRKCLWERLYMLLTGRFAEIHRRKKKTPVFAGKPGEGVRFWYHSPRELEILLGQNFTRMHSRPVGLFLPPSYLGPFFLNKAWLLGILAFKERIFGGIPALSDYGDHYLVHFKKP